LLLLIDPAVFGSINGHYANCINKIITAILKNLNFSDAAEEAVVLKKKKKRVSRQDMFAAIYI